MDTLPDAHKLAADFSLATLLAKLAANLGTWVSFCQGILHLLLLPPGCGLQPAACRWLLQRCGPSASWGHLPHGWPGHVLQGRFCEQGLQLMSAPAELFSGPCCDQQKRLQVNRLAKSGVFPSWKGGSTRDNALPSRPRGAKPAHDRDQQEGGGTNSEGNNPSKEVPVRPRTAWLLSIFVKIYE